MSRRRFFVPTVHHQQAELAGEDAHHLTRVLRVEPGQRYEISDNTAVYLAEVAEAHKSRVVFRVIERLPANPLPVRLALYFALIKFDRLEWLLEKGTEVGVETFVPVLAERTEKGLSQAAGKRMERWCRIVAEASQQCRRDRLPEIAVPQGFRAAIAEAPPLRYLLDEDAAAPVLLNKLPGDRTAGDHVSLLLGPEGGWTERERDSALDAGWQPVSLGPQILRSETAAMVGAALVVSAWAAARATTSPPGLP